MLYNYNNMTVTIITYYNYTILYIPFNLMIQMSVRITEFSVGSQQVLPQVLSQQRGPAKCPTHPSSVWSSLEAPGTHGTHGPWPHGEMRISGISAGNEYGIWLNMIEYDWIWHAHACTTSGLEAFLCDHLTCNTGLPLILSMMVTMMVAIMMTMVMMLWTWCLSGVFHDDTPNDRIQMYQYVSIYHHICSHLDSHLSLFASKLCCRK
jgi:hypothetical protein